MNRKKLSWKMRKTVCMILTAAMLFTNMEITAYVELSEKEMLSEQTSTDVGIEDSLLEKAAEEDVAEEISLEEEKEEEHLTTKNSMEPLPDEDEKGETTEETRTKAELTETDPTEDLSGEEESGFGEYSIDIDEGSSITMRKKTVQKKIVG